MGSSNSKVLSEPPTFHETDAHKVPYPALEGKETYWSSDKTSHRDIRLAAEGAASRPAPTIPQTFKKCVELNGSMPALRVERPCPAYDKKLGFKQAPSSDFKEWKTWDYKAYYDECHLAARGFVAMGLERFDGVNIYGFNCPEWVMAQNAGIMAGGIAAGIYPSDTPAQVTYKASHSGAVVACCQSSKADMFVAAFNNGDLPKLKAIVVWDQDIEEEKVTSKTGTLIKTSWQKMLVKGEEVKAEVIDTIIESQHPGDTACLIYTSGTTGSPKAVMITHDNILYEAASALQCIKVPTGEERIISYLPLSHVAGCMIDIIMPLIMTSAKSNVYCVAGFARVYDLSKGSFGDRLRCIKPTIFLGVPRVWEKIQAGIQKAGAGLSGAKAWISANAKAIGLEHAMNCQLGGSGAIPSFHGTSDSLVFSSLKAKLGLEECTYAMTGAAPITFDTLKYFGQLGLQINEAYGMSECTGATTFSNDEAHIWGSCGWTMPGTETKVFKVNPNDLNDKKECPLAADIFHATEEEQGEICFRGRHIMKGYLANPEFGQDHVDEINAKNASAIDADGWLHSGDKGCISTKGMLKITGRYKELIIGSGGENIAPVPIEDNVKSLCNAISNIMMIGEKKKYNTAFVTLKAVGATGEAPGGDQLDDLAVLHGETTISGASENKAYIQMITDAIIATNNNGEVCPSSASKIQKFCILPADFSVETNELTPTLKLKRSTVMKDPRYADALARLYAPENKTNTYIPFNVVQENTAE